MTEPSKFKNEITRAKYIENAVKQFERLCSKANTATNGSNRQKLALAKLKIWVSNHPKTIIILRARAVEMKQNKLVKLIDAIHNTNKTDGGVNNAR